MAAWLRMLLLFVALAWSPVCLLLLALLKELLLHFLQALSPLQELLHLVISLIIAADHSC